MGGHGGLNILPQKRWNVYNYDNREKVRRDEEAAARDEQLKRDDARKRDAELRLEKLRQARGLASASVNEAAAPSSSESKSEETRLENDSNHINLFEGIRIFDPIEAKPESNDQRPVKKVKKEQQPRVVTAEDEKYKLGYGIVGKGTKLPWYLEKPTKKSDEKSDDDDDDDLRPAKKKSNGKKTPNISEEIIEPLVVSFVSLDCPVRVCYISHFNNEKFMLFPQEPELIAFRLLCPYIGRLESL
nr:leukocyte receptor cluster member 1 homolog [Ipomoea batatas]